MKNILFFGIKLFVSGILLYVIVMKIDWGQFSLSIRQGSLGYICIGVLFGAVFNMIKFLKWFNLVKTGNDAYTYWDGAKSYMIGNALGMVTPMRAGDLGRAFYFSSEDRPRIVGLTIIDRLIDLVIVFILAVGGSFILINKGFGVLVVFFAIFSIFLLYSPYLMQNFLTRLISGGHIREKLLKLADIFQTLNSKKVTIALILSAVAFLSIVFEFYFLVLAFERIHLSSTYLVAPLVTLSSVIPVSLMGFGVREGVSVYLLSIYDISPGTALSAAILFFMINNLSISIVGLVFLSKVEFGIKKVKMARIPVYERQFHADSTD